MAPSLGLCGVAVADLPGVLIQTLPNLQVIGPVGLFLYDDAYRSELTKSTYNSGIGC